MGAKLPKSKLLGHVIPGVNQNAKNAFDRLFAKEEEMELEVATE